MNSAHQTIILLICRFEQFLNYCFQINRITASHQGQGQQYVTQRSAQHAIAFPCSLCQQFREAWSAWGPWDLLPFLHQFKAGTPICLRFDSGCLKKFGISSKQSPRNTRNSAFLVCGWFLLLFVGGSFIVQKGFFSVFFLIQELPRVVACFIVTFFSYTLLHSQSQLGKVSWGNQNLLLPL